MWQPDNNEQHDLVAGQRPEDMIDAPPPCPETEAMIILIVDDDPVARSLMQDTLEDEGYTVIEASDGLEACRRCEETVPSLMVVDAMMPNMDGFELCRVLRDRAETRHVPILMATGLDDVASIANAYEAGATDFVSKPVNWLLLCHRIRYMLRGARALEDLRQSQESLEVARKLERAQSARFAAALSNMSQGLCMVGADERLIVANTHFQEIFELPMDAVVPGRSMIETLRSSPLFSPESDSSPNAGLQDYLDLTLQRRSSLLVKELANGRTITITHEPMASGGFVDTFTDVTEQKRTEAQIKHMALHDHLTDLPNRVLLRQRMEQAMHRAQRGERCAVLYLDLDQFKGVNDTLGHLIGDALLKAVSERLSRLVRSTDTVSRLGGDEFAIIQTDIESPRAATNLATRILRELAVPFDVAGHHVVVGVSIGIAIAPLDGDDPDELFKSADIALYQAKNDGRNRFRSFEIEMNALMQTRRELESDLRQALAANELELYFQPLVNLAKEEITGFEALLRWNSPTRGMVSPGQFIPIAEEVGIILQIGEWVLHEACRQAASWPVPLKVAVNISTTQFNGRNLVQTVMHALEESGLDPTRLELEITETVMVQDFDKTLSVLHKLKDLGVSISMDDFGTGYSSLSYMRSFPFDKIKIDQSFIRDIGKNAESMAIIRAVTSMCDSLGVTVTAEGVETSQQLNLLQAEKCTEIQGYLISKPRPAREIAGLITGFEMSGTNKLFSGTREIAA